MNIKIEVYPSEGVYCYLTPDKIVRWRYREKENGCRKCIVAPCLGPNSIRPIMQRKYPWASIIIYERPKRRWSHVRG